MASHRENARHREAFEAWYAADREFGKVWKNLETPESTLRKWGDRFKWHERADARDLEAQRVADAKAVKERAERQRRRRHAGELMTARGLEFYQKNGIETAADATRAIKYGTEIERKEDGVPDWVMLILNAEPNELEKLARGLTDFAADPEETGAGDDSTSPEADGEDE